MIFGRPGSGKSTFAHTLSEKTGLPVYHLDRYFFVSGWQERDPVEFRVLQEKLVNEDAWIIDGNSTRTLETRWSKALCVLYFNYPRLTCLRRLIKRRILGDTAHIEDRAEGCNEILRFQLIKYLWSFDKRVSSAIDTLHNKYPATTFVEIKNDTDALEAMEKIACR